MKIGLVDDRRIDLDKLTGFISGMEDVEIVFSPHLPMKPMNLLKRKLLISLLPILKCHIYPATN